MACPPVATQPVAMQEVKRRGRSRDMHAHAAVLDATLAELSDHGFLGLSIEGVALRAGVAKTTIYRWWPDKVALALEALRSLPELPEPDTGTLATDLEQLRRALVDVVATTALGTVLPALIAEHQRDTEHRPALDEYISSRTAPFQRAVQRAIERGELPATTDADLAALVIVAPLSHSILFTDRAFDEPTWARVVAITTAGIRAQEAPP
jgi:AcrR family transcriptional regulator